MNSINRYFVDSILGPLIGLADSPADASLYENINTDDETQVKKLFAEVIKPDFETEMEKVKIKSKEALSFYLTSDKIDFAKIISSNLLPIAPPSNSKLFFVWLWEILFENERYDNIDISNFYEKPDLEEPWKILLE